MAKQLDRAQRRSGAARAGSARAPIRPPPPGPAPRGPAPLPGSANRSPQIQAGPLTAQLPSFGAAISGLNAGFNPSSSPLLPSRLPTAPRRPRLSQSRRIPSRSLARREAGAPRSATSPKIHRKSRASSLALQRLQRAAIAQRSQECRLQTLFASGARNGEEELDGRDSRQRALGTRGIVVLKFVIDRHGAVPSLEFSTPSGNDFDRAAVAGISASVPFPPLPAEYPGRSDPPANGFRL